MFPDWTVWCLIVVIITCVIIIGVLKNILRDSLEEAVCVMEATLENLKKAQETINDLHKEVWRLERDKTTKP